MNIREAAVFLALDHCERVPTTTDVFWLPDEEEVYLVEATSDVATDGEIFPVRMWHPDLGYHYSVVLISPGELKLIQEGKLMLPSHWGLDALTQLERLVPRKGDSHG